MKMSLRFVVLAMSAASLGPNFLRPQALHAGKLAQAARMQTAASVADSPSSTPQPTVATSTAMEADGKSRSLVELARPARRIVVGPATPGTPESSAPALLPENLAHKPAAAPAPIAGSTSAASSAPATTPQTAEATVAPLLLGIPTAATETASKYRNVLREPRPSTKVGGLLPIGSEQAAAAVKTQTGAASTETKPPVLRTEPTPKVILNPDVAPPPAISIPTGPLRTTTIVPSSKTPKPTGTPSNTTLKPTATPQPTAAAGPVPAQTEPRVGGSTPTGRVPVIVSDDREPGAPAVERKMPIGREPADAQDQKLFEAEQQQPTLTPEMELLRKRLQYALAFYYKNWTLNTRDHSPWEVMHAIVAYGVDTRLLKGGPGGPSTTAIGHLCFSGICNNQPILTIRGGKLYALRGPGVQGHSGQFLAILAQSYLQRDYPLYVGGKQYTLEDLIQAEQLDCESGTELTFKLIALMHYLPSDATWVNFQGQTWSLDRLVREEIVQPIRGAACGGTHRLMGLSYAVRKREQRGEPVTGVYQDAKKYIEQYHRYTWSLQNRDGSFSTAWFVRPEARNDLDRRLQTTGHTLEWLCFSLSDEQLRDPRVVKSVRYVTDLLLNEQISEWEVGHLGHALHALQMYNERVFGGPVRSFESLVTRKPQKTVR